jgi:hypothetical protein
MIVHSFEDVLGSVLNQRHQVSDDVQLKFACSGYESCESVTTGSDMGEKLLKFWEIDLYQGRFSVYLSSG